MTGQFLCFFLFQCRLGCLQLRQKLQSQMQSNAVHFFLQISSISVRLITQGYFYSNPTWVHKIQHYTIQYHAILWNTTQYHTIQGRFLLAIEFAEWSMSQTSSIWRQEARRRRANRTWTGARQRGEDCPSSKVTQTHSCFAFDIIRFTPFSKWRHSVEGVFL